MWVVAKSQTTSWVTKSLRFPKLIVMRMCLKRVKLSIFARMSVIMLRCGPSFWNANHQQLRHKQSKAKVAYSLFLCHETAGAQHGLAADGASRPRDRCYFEGWNQPDCFPNLSVRRR